MVYKFSLPTAQELRSVIRKEPKATSYAHETEAQCERPKNALTRSLPKLEFFAHILAVTVVGILAYYNITSYFWQEVSDGARAVETFFGLQQTSVLKALQFTAKLHELLMQASLSAIGLYYAHKLLVGSKGLPLGLIDSPYNVGPGMLRHWRFWEAGLLRSHYHLFILFLIIAGVLSVAVGPTSAILMIPSLDWWQISDPFKGQPMTTYFMPNGSGLWPSTFELSSYDIFYPDLGFKTYCEQDPFNQTGH
jgi:hypothetical protein